MILSAFCRKSHGFSKTTYIMNILSFTACSYIRKKIRVRLLEDFSLASVYFWRSVNSAALNFSPVILSVNPSTEPKILKHLQVPKFYSYLPGIF